ncbi:TPA: hypothetical protein ACXRZE_001363 [Klebsiella variicola subsp. variicola]
MKEELLLLKNQLKMGHRISFAEAMLLQRAIDILVNNAGNSPVIGIDLASGPDRTVEVHYVAPPGYVMVPKEPTEAMMLHNSGCQHHAWDDPDCAMRQTRRLIWSHMLAAAPQEVKGE